VKDQEKGGKHVGHTLAVKIKKMAGNVSEQVKNLKRAGNVLVTPEQVKGQEKGEKCGSLLRR
jgi:hypothetical protein